MKQNKLSSFLAISICLELMISPIAVHADANKILETATKAVNTGMGMYNQANGGAVGNSGAFAAQMQMIKNSGVPSVDGTYNLKKFASYPGFIEYLNLPVNKNNPAMHPIQSRFNCLTLPIKFHQTYAEVCTRGLSPSLPQPLDSQANEAAAYGNQYLQLGDNYDSFALNSWEDPDRQQYGYACMKNAGDILEGFFQYRLNELEKIKTQMFERVAAFKTLTDTDVDKMKLYSVVLSGTGHPSAANISAKNNLELLEYGKRFDNNACNSISPSSEMGQLGLSKGIKGIESKLVTDFNAPPPGETYSPKEYLKSHGNIVKDIKDLAKKMAKQSRLEFNSVSKSSSSYLDFITKIKDSVGSETGVHDGMNSAFFLDIQSKFQEERTKFTNAMGIVTKELGPVGSDAYEALTTLDNDAVFETELGAVENQVKSKCIASAPVDDAVNQIYDPSLSNEANKASTAKLKIRIKEIMKDLTLTPEQKMQQLNDLGLERFQVKFSTGYDTQYLNGDEVKTKRVGASDRVSPVGYFNDIVKNCEASFSVNKLKTRMSAKKAMKELRDLKRAYKKLADDNAANIEKEVVNKMVNCGNNSERANSTVAGSCNADKFKMKSSATGFCANAAMSCATNMKSCTEFAQAMVKDTVVKRDDLKLKYNSLMTKAKKDIIAMFKENLNTFTREGEKMRSVFKKGGFNAPQGLEWDLTSEDRFVAGFTDEDGVQLEDPTKFAELFERNINKLKEQVQAQQDLILGDENTPSAKLAENRKNEYKNLKAKAKETQDLCVGRYNKWANGLDESINKADQDFAKNMSEFGEKKNKFCGKFTGIMVKHVLAGCKDNLAEISVNLINAAQKIGDSKTAAEASEIGGQMEAYCYEFGSQVDNDGKKTITAGQVCGKALFGDEEVQKAITKLAEIKNPGHTYVDLCNALSSTTTENFKNYCTKKPGKKTADDLNPEPSFVCNVTEEQVVMAYEGKERGSKLGENSKDENWELGNKASDDDTYASNFCNYSNNQMANTKSNNQGRTVAKGKDGNGVTK